MPTSRHTPEQRKNALDLYRQHGPAETERRTGIPRTTISSWASRSGVRTDAPSTTRAAIEQAQLTAAERRAELKVKLLTRALDALDRMTEPHEEFVGQHGRRVVYQRAPSGAFKQYAQSVKELVNTLRLEEGQATSRTENVDQIDQEIGALLQQMTDRENNAARETAEPPATETVEVPER